MKGGLFGLIIFIFLGLGPRGEAFQGFKSAELGLPLRNGLRISHENTPR